MTFSFGFLIFFRFSFTGYPIAISSNKRLEAGIPVNCLISFSSNQPKMQEPRSFILCSQCDMSSSDSNINQREMLAFYFSSKQGCNIGRLFYNQNMYRGIFGELIHA